MAGTPPWYLELRQWAPGQWSAYCTQCDTWAECTQCTGHELQEQCAGPAGQAQAQGAPEAVHTRSFTRTPLATPPPARVYGPAGRPTAAKGPPGPYSRLPPLGINRPPPPVQPPFCGPYVPPPAPQGNVAPSDFQIIEKSWRPLLKVIYQMLDTLGKFFEMLEQKGVSMSDIVNANERRQYNGAGDDGAG